MEIDKGLFGTDATERLEVVLVEAAKTIIDVDELLAVRNLYQLIEGYAQHMAEGMMEAGFAEEEASMLAWRTAWGKFKTILDTQTDSIHAIATRLERNLCAVVPDQRVNEAGHPLDAPTRSFYRVFICNLEHPAIHPTSIWLFEDD